MRVLAIETSGYSESVAVAEGGAVLGEIFVNSGRANAENIVLMTDALLRQIGMDAGELEGVAVSAGPGAFTPLRVGMSAAKGFSLALGIPIAGVSSLETLAMGAAFTHRRICTIIDAKKGEVFAAFFESSDAGGIIKRVTEDELTAIDALCRQVFDKTLFIGSGAVVHRDYLSGLLGECVCFAEPIVNLPRASNCAILGMRKLLAEAGEDVLGLAPRYLKRTDAEISKGRCVE